MTDWLLYCCFRMVRLFVPPRIRPSIWTQGRWKNGCRTIQFCGSWHRLWEIFWPILWRWIRSTSTSMSKASNLATLQKLCSVVLLKLARQPVMSVLMRYYWKIWVFCHFLSFLKICTLIRFACSFAAPPTELNCLLCKKLVQNPILLYYPNHFHCRWNGMHL